MPSQPSYQGKSPWARAPERDTKTPRPESAAPLPNAPFRPILGTNADAAKLRRKVKSSAYGRKAAVKKVNTENIPTREEQEMEGATFRPKLVKSKDAIQMRKKAASSGYGKQTARPKTASFKEDAPSFRPEIGISPSSRALIKTVGSSGYGKVLAERKAAPTKEEPSFTPDLNVSKTSKKLREKAPSGKHLQPRDRPETAPADLSDATKPVRVQMYTLAADKNEEPEEEEEDNKVPFVLDTWTVAAAVKAGGLIPSPAPITPLKTQLKLKQETPSSGYTTVYTPPQGARVVKEPEPTFKFGAVTEVYADRPENVEPAPRQAEQKKLFERAKPSGYGPSGGYEPKHVVIPHTPKEDKTFVVSAKSDTAAIGCPVDELPVPPRSKTLDMVPSSMYGKQAPPTTPRAPAPAKSSPMKMGTATTALLPVSMLGTAAERDLVVVRSVTAHGNVFEGEQTSILASDN